VFAEAELLARTFVKPPQITRLAQSLNEYGISNNVLTTDEMVTAFTQACEQQG
jgi:hypothetical protein